MKEIILSICIPTYNRGEILRMSLEAIKNQTKYDSDLVEIIVSDNCSKDNTPQIADEFHNDGLNFTYNRNEENLGAARNFLKLMNMAKGRYILLLGDDDFLSENAINILLTRLQNSEYGALYIDTQHKLNGGFKEYKTKEEFIKAISYYYTFMSSFVFRKEIVSQIANPERYIPSHLLQMPFYIKSTLTSDVNAITDEPIFAEIGKAAQSNGGYNFFDVFVHWYQEIWAEYVDDKKLLHWLKKDIWLFVWMFTRRLLIDKNVGNFKVDNGWQILFKYYGKEWYFWWYLFKYPFGVVKRKLKKLI